MAILVRGKNPKKPYTIRYWVAGKQRERSFRTKKEADDFKAQVEYEARAHIFVDPKLSSIHFAEYALGVVEKLAVSEGTRRAYLGLLNAWISPWAGDRTLSQVAGDREGASDLFNRVMKHLSYNRRGSARTVVLAALDEAVRAGRLNKHRLSDIPLTRSDEVTQRRDFIFPPYENIVNLSKELEHLGLIIWLMRGCGLRIREALGVHREHFRDGGKVLRVCQQASVNGDKAVPLKHRKAGEFRDVPVPGYLWNLAKGIKKGPVCPAPNGLYFSYSVAYKSFVKSRDLVGISSDFVPHSLRHAFASALLANLVPVTDVAEWLGHQEINVTYKIYAHLIPSATGRARDVLDREFDQWSQRGW